MATALLDEWTEEKCIQLIREFRKKPLLWDQRDSLFFKKNLKPLAWEEIGDVLNIPADHCKHKMNILMSSFRREKAKILHSINNVAGDKLKDSSQLYTSSWFAFKEMSFLLDKKSERKRQLNGDSDETEEDDEGSSSIKVTLLKHHLEPQVKRTKTIKSAKGNNTQRITQTELKETNVPQNQSTAGPSQTPSEKDEEIKSFTSFIGNKMKKYTDKTKNAVQQAICDIIFRADQNYYEDVCYEKFPIMDDNTDPLSKQILEDGTIIKVQTDFDTD